MPKLTTIGVKNAKPGRHADGAGLHLVVKPSGARSWVLRIQADNRRRDIGLGSVDLNAKRVQDDPSDAIPVLSRRVLTLTEAREKAALLRKVAKAGRDPVVERDRERVVIPTFAAAAKACHAELQAGWALKNAAAFLSSLEEHAFAKLGPIRVDQIEPSHIRDMLAPIWTRIPVMARKVRQRVGTVLNFANSKGWRASEAPGRSVTMGLPRHGTGGNFAAMPYQDVPAFVADLGAKTETIGRLALLFTIHTAARSGEVRAARWSQIDRDQKLWDRPSDMMKMKAVHSVTLTEAAIAVLDRAAQHRADTAPDSLIFAGLSGKMLSDMTLSKILRDAALPFTPHGFRSSFRDWAAERMPEVPDAVAEAALSHIVPDAVIRAYKRTTFVEMRRTLMGAWATFLTEPGATG